MDTRIATLADAEKLRNIYGQYINTAITFEYTLPTKEEFATRIAHIQENYPYLVCEEDNEIYGYAYAHRHMEREAYQWNAELSVYLDQTKTSQGLGTKLYGILEDILKLQGVHTLYGGVTIPNPKSKGLHLSLGFSSLGVYHHTGYKCGKWHDVEWFEKQILPYDNEPKPFSSIQSISPEIIGQIIKKHQ